MIFIRLVGTCGWKFVPEVSREQGYKNSGHRVAVGDKFCTVAAIICGSFVRNLQHITPLARSVLRWLLYFWKIRAPRNY